jgi:signal transduction histidine kinase
MSANRVVIGGLITMRDEEKTREELLEELAMLRARNALLEEVAVERPPRDFKPFLAHKIRNILNGTLGFASLLEDETAGMLNEEQRHYAARIVTSVDLMINLVNELVEQTEIEQQASVIVTEIGIRG